MILIKNKFKEKKKITYIKTHSFYFWVEYNWESMKVLVVVANV